jgi:hypothetical protein
MNQISNNEEVLRIRAYTWFLASSWKAKRKIKLTDLTFTHGLHNEKISVSFNSLMCTFS